MREVTVQIRRGGRILDSSPWPTVPRIGDHISLGPYEEGHTEIEGRVVDVVWVGPCLAHVVIQ